MTEHTQTPTATTGAGPTTPDEHRAQGHWLLAKMGKRVLRPGGLELTRKLLDHLAVAPSDRVVELGPGIGRTAQLLVSKPCAGYTGVEPNPEARARLAGWLGKHANASCIAGDAISNDLPDGCADVVVSEAMLTMQSQEDKQAIAARVWRMLTPGGRWGIHELSLRPDDLDPSIDDEICKAVSRTIKVGARPLTVAAWRRILTDQGFEIEWTGHGAMRLVEPSRIIADEGLLGALRFFNNVRRNPAARARILAMRKVFRAHSDHLAAVAMTVVKPATATGK